MGCHEQGIEDCLGMNDRSDDVDKMWDVQPLRGLSAAAIHEALA